MVIREELFELVVQLSGKSFVVGENKRWTLQVLYYVCYSKRLSRAGHTKECLELFSRLNTLR